jgi:hypothetical protein
MSEPDKPPRNLKAMLSEAKDTSELMVDLAYAALFFSDERMADEVGELEERLSDLVHEMYEICILAAGRQQEGDIASGMPGWAAESGRILSWPSGGSQNPQWSAVVSVAETATRSTVAGPITPSRPP